MKADWHREAVGGLWHEVGKLQFDFLVGQGLRPEHYLLDVGCGCLRGGVHFIEYLQSGHYFGLDINQTLLDQGCLELERYHLTDKVVTLVQSDDFDFSALGQRFQFALAQSLFTHLPLNSIISCLKKMEKALADGGQFYATFFENKEGKNNLEPIKHPSIDHIGLESYFDRDPYHYDFGTFEWICDGTSLEAKYIGDWQHPRDQKMMVFTKASPS